MGRRKTRFDPRKYGLPADYGLDMTVAGRRQARRAVLTGWFDPHRIEVLCTDVEKYILAHRLWVDFYLKRDPLIGARYHWRDPLHKYDMLRTIMQPPAVASTPTKVAMTAARGTAKTITCVFEMASMCAVVRPNTSIVISETNYKRTKEEIGYIKFALEEGVFIKEDFGRIAPVKRGLGTDSWTEDHLGMMRFNGSFVAGVSALASHRGRHLRLGLLDDPDDGQKSKRLQWRLEFFEWLFHTWLPMFDRGSVTTWIQTMTPGGLISLAMRRQQDAINPEEEGEREYDERFEDWHRKNYDLLREDKGGKTVSIWPQKIAVKDYEHLVKSLGRRAALAEYRGVLVAEGELMFRRHQYRHGFMHAIAKDGGEYMLDLKTGQRMPWSEFLKTLYKVGGGDIADSLDPQADRSGLVIIGIDPDGVVYVLDCYNRRCHSDVLVDVALGELCRVWGVEEFGWEIAAMQAVTKRYADRYAARLRHEGFFPPVNRGITNQNTDKKRRIIGILSPLVVNDEIRFLRAQEFVDAEGVRHTPVEHSRMNDYERLLAEIDDYTDGGAAGHDDAIDGLHIALRVGWHRRGDAIVRKKESPADGLDAWHEAGIEFNRNTVTPELWPMAWLQDADKEYLAKSGVCAGAEYLEDDPYDGYG